MRIEFKDRFTDAVLHAEDVPDDSPNPLRTALEQAGMRARTPAELRDLREETADDMAGLEQDADEMEDDGGDREILLLKHRIAAIDRELEAPSDGANLDGANLARANLARANLAGANLARANLDGANLARANLDGANLDGANLDGANLDGANLDGANLARANLDGANLARANLDGAYLANARNLPSGIAAVDPPEPYMMAPETIAAQVERARRYRAAHPEVPVVEGLDGKILHAVTAGGGTLQMSQWHGEGSCGTTHCRAGWAIHLAGKAGYELERELGRDSARAGSMIYMASVGFVPWFFDQDDDHALKDIERCAAEQAAHEAAVADEAKADQAP